MNITKNAFIKKGDVGILLSVLVVAAVFYFFQGRRAEGETVYITVSGETTFYPLEQDTVISLESEADAYNTIVIRDRAVYMENASCPDQICVHHKTVSKDGETIICLPNQVFVRIESDRQSAIDN